MLVVYMILWWAKKQEDKSSLTSYVGQKLSLQRKTIVKD